MPTTLRAHARRSLLSSALGLLILPGLVAAQSPSATPIASVVPAASPAACVPGQVGRIDHPTGCTDVVLRMDVGGGFTTPEVSLTDTPEFTLYGDDSAVFRPQPKDGQFAAPGQPLVPLVRAVLSPDQVDALLVYALGPGGLADAGEAYLNPMIADAPTTVFTLDAAGMQKIVTVQALGVDDPSGRDAAARASFQSLATLLGSFEQQVAAGRVESAALYQPAAYRGILTVAQPGTGEPSAPWPWADLAPSDFIGPADGIARFAPMTPAQVAEITPVPSGGVINVRLTTTDAGDVYVSVRPLLPDEPALPDGISG